MTRAALSCLLAASASLLTACSDTPDVEMSPVETEPPAASVVQATDREIAFGKLAGTLREAGRDGPAILIVPGSGPTDRDGNNPLGVEAASYRLLAEGLSEQGISSLRVDKRGMFGSSAAGDPNAVTMELYAQDYLGWAARLRKETGQSCVYLLGHSEGGPMVAAAAAREGEGICGLILVASPGRPVFDVLRDQLRANPANAPILPQAMDALDRLEAGERVDPQTLHPGLRPLFDDAVQGFMISAYGVDPVELLRQAALPTLVVQGTRDVQVSNADAARLAETGATLIMLDGMNHVLKDAPEDQAGNLATYADPDLPLADGVVDAIADFVTVEG